MGGFALWDTGQHGFLEGSRGRFRRQRPRCSSSIAAEHAEVRARPICSRAVRPPESVGLRPARAEHGRATWGWNVPVIITGRAATCWQDSVVPVHTSVYILTLTIQEAILTAD
jgi:hypothetical protein